MLGKIIKYDLKATARFFIPMYIVFAIITVFNKIFIELAPNFESKNHFLSAASVLIFILYIMTLLVSNIMTIVFLVIHFYKSMTGDQGYLTFTLPVKASTHVNGKIISSALWIFISLLLSGLSILVLLFGHGYIPEISKVISEIVDSIKYLGSAGDITLFFIFMIIAMISGIFCTTFMFYASISLGHLFGKYRVLGSIVSYIGFYVVTQIISTIIMFRIDYNTFENMQGYEVLPGINKVIGLILAITLIFNIIYYFITTYVFSKKLNLE